MGKNKLKRYAEIPELENVFEPGDQPGGSKEWMCGKWNSGIFGRQAPLILELACGKGDYTLALARRNSNFNYVGIDVKGDRIWKGATIARDENLHNVRFIRGRIDHITNYFDQDEVDEIWITFPDPFPQKSKKKRRLTHSVFLVRYHKIIKPGGEIHLKSDDDQLIEFTLEQLQLHNIPPDEVIYDLHATQRLPDELYFRTYYEDNHIREGKTIKYIRFRLDNI